MESYHIIYLVIFILCIGMAAFFAGSETAFIALQKLRLRHLLSKGEEDADKIASVIANPSRFLSTVLVGVNLTETAAAALGTLLIVALWGEKLGAIIAIVLVAVITLIFAELVPKTISANNPERIARLYARPVSWIAWLLSPVVTALSWISNIFTRAAGGTPISHSLVSEEELRTAIDVGTEEGVVEKGEAEMLHNVFEFGDTRVSEVITPRPDIVAVEQGTRICDFLAIYAEKPYSRFPVYEGSLDNITGIISIKDLVIAQAKGTINENSTVDELIRPALFVPETKKVRELFTEMRKGGAQLAVVVDEFGVTSGIVSMDRIVEEIVGSLRDELAAEDTEYEAIDEHTYLIEGSMRISEVNEKLEVNIPEGDYETIAGFALYILGHIPHEGEPFKYGNLKFTIAELESKRIGKIMLTRESSKETTSDAKTEN